MPRDAGPGDFGGYLASVQERDIDLLLMEEFHVSPDFVVWFADRCGVPDARPDGAWHGVTDADGETDLLLRVRSGGRRVGILVENKVGAPEQERQDERYHLRAARLQHEGKFDAFTTCICAPAAYLSSLRADSAYQTRIDYEAVRDRFAGSKDARSTWRAAVMTEAIEQGRRGYRMIVNEAVSGFHLDFWHHLQNHHPELVMRRPTPKGGKSNWILFKGADFPPRVGFHLKLDQQVVELGFPGRRAQDLHAATPHRDASIKAVQKGGTAALSIAVPPLDRTRALADQASELGGTMAAVAKLLPFGTAAI